METGNRGRRNSRQEHFKWRKDCSEASGLQALIMHREDCRCLKWLDESGRRGLQGLQLGKETPVLLTLLPFSVGEGRKEGRVILIEVGWVVKHVIIDRSTFLLRLKVSLNNSFIYLFIRGLLNTYFMSGSVLGTRDPEICEALSFERVFKHCCVS